MALRCSFCHGQAGSLTACAECGTQLHSDCWVDAGACPTLGCVAAMRTPASLPGPRPVGAPVATCLGLLGGAIMLLIVGAAIFSWWGAPRIEIRNDSGRVLTNVHVEAFQYETGERLAKEDSLEPGESMSVSGGDLDYELKLRSVTFDGPAGVTGPRLEHGLYALPFERAVYAIEADGNLRTLVGPWGGPCVCPASNASGHGSVDCPDPFHRDAATKAALAPRAPR